METSTITLVNDVQPTFWWPRAFPYIKGIIDSHPGYNEEAVYSMLQSKVLRLHVIKEERMIGCMVTMLQQYPASLDLFVLFAGGNNVNKWSEIEDQLTEYATKLGATTISFWGRVGWKKPFKHIDAKYSVFVKKV